VLAKAVVAAGGRLASFRRLWETPPPWNPDPRRTELVEWLTARARERGIALKPDDALYVAAATGNDLYALDAALDRVARRGAEGVRAVVGWTSAASPFEAAEDVCRGDAARAAAGLEALFRGGFQEKDGSRAADLGAVFVVLMGSLRGKLRQSLAGAAAQERGEDPVAAAGVTNPRQRGELEARLRARPAAEWRAMLTDLAALERRARSGPIVDVNDVVAFALRWARRGAPAAGAGPGRR
jgi:DNA polymerase III delta subunit